jgi:hypothetical protein
MVDFPNGEIKFGTSWNSSPRKCRLICESLWDLRRWFISYNSSRLFMKAVALTSNYSNRFDFRSGKVGHLIQLFSQVNELNKLCGHSCTETCVSYVDLSKVCYRRELRHS